MKDSYQKIQESRSPTMKLRKLGFLPGNPGVQESYKEIQDFPGILAGISGIQDSCQEIQDFPGSQTLGPVRFCIRSCKILQQYCFILQKN